MKISSWCVWMSFCPEFRMKLPQVPPCFTSVSSAGILKAAISWHWVKFAINQSFFRRSNTLKIKKEDLLRSKDVGIILIQWNCTSISPMSFSEGFYFSPLCLSLRDAGKATPSPSLSHNKHWMEFILQALAVESLAPQQKRLKVSLGTSHRGTSFIPWINRSFGSTKRMEAGVFLPHANLSHCPSSENCSLALQRILSTLVTICFCFILTVQTRTTITLDAEWPKIIYAFILII